MSTAAVPTLRRSFGIIRIGVRRQPWWFALAVAGSALYGVMTVGTAWVIGRVTREYVTPAVEAGEVTTSQLLAIAGWMVGVVLLNVIGVVIRRVAAGVTMYNVGADFRRQVTRQYLRLPLSWHHRHPSGQLLSNANADVEATWNVFAPLPMALGVVIMLVAGVVQMLAVDQVMALIGLTVFPALFVANMVFQRHMSPRVTRAQQLRADVSEVAHESFEAGLVVKAMGREAEETERFAVVANKLKDANIAVGRTRGTFDPVIEAIPTIGTLLVLAVGTGRVASGAITPSEVVQMAYLISILAFPVRALGWVLGELPRTVVGWERVDAVLRATGEMTYGERDIPEQGASGAHLSGVDYLYDVVDEEGGLSQHQAIHGVTIEVPAGSTTALVGPTGSGKSTLTNLTLRLVDPHRGSVTIDDVDVREVTRGGVPSVGVLVPQQTFMFDDTVRGNVTLGGDFTDEQVWEALEVAQATGFVQHLEHGLDTRVGERGASLSGGQRQRVALARAVIRRPQLLVLDDATSAVDPSVELSILSALRSTSAGTTVLVVAYRMSTIVLADDVIYLERGHVIDHGTHAELLDRCEGYERLVTAYAREAAERAAVAADEEAAQ
ncbi:ABC-type multidrug transport system, ATPase and permease component [Pedococcus cremeus]|uniref:ABC-type multidrug transport system, ATPase and permease component n=1 Tax=Pedococcus cremeus TaxID=587636 RepID=A0A1H9X3J7_9MICO|nr:ABC transporter ATP-binding protein [Pedococcus cremeus]SES40213.1 ABC-type multidrug transport system, ATPase and permease component [Pedococcus cremeus]